MKSKFLQNFSVIISGIAFAILFGGIVFYLTSSSKNKIPEDKIAKSGIMWASERESMMTGDPALGYTPGERKITANLQTLEKISIKNSLNANARAIAGVEWRERGPISVGGRTRALMFDPNDPIHKKVWAGGATGGIWYNNDITEMSSDWHKVDDLMANLSITSLAYDQNNTNIFYASSGEYGFQVTGAGGIWKSSDAGQTWSLLASTRPDTRSRFTWIQKLAVASNGNLIAATMDVRNSVNQRGGLLISTDGGTSWLPKADVLGKVNNFSDIDIASDGTIYAVNGFYHNKFDGSAEVLSLYKSSDNGLNFTKTSIDLSSISILNYSTFVNRIEIASAPSNPSRLYIAISDDPLLLGDGRGDVRFMATSDDAGITWTPINIPTVVASSNEYFSDCLPKQDTSFVRNQGSYNLVLKVHPTDESIVFAGGIGWHRSTNFGETWEDLMGEYACSDFDYHHVDVHTMEFKPGSTNEVITGSDGGITYSPNINTQFPKYYPTNENYRVSQFYSVAMDNIPGSNYFLGGTQDNGSWVFKQELSGLNQAQTPVGGDGAYCFIDQDEPNIQLVSTQFNGFFQTVDGFETWSSLNISPQNNSSVNFINPAEYDSEKNILYTAASPNQMVKVTGIGQADPQETIITIPEFGGRNITALKLSPHIADRLIIVSTWGGTSTQVAIIDDASLISDENTAANITINDFTVNSNTSGDMGTLFLGLESPSSATPYPTSVDIGTTDDQILITFSNYGINSVWETIDGGVTWSNKDNSSLPDMPIRWGLYNPENTKEVILATESGIYSTDDFSANTPEWNPTVDGLANVRCDMLRYRPADGLVAVATHGRGIFTTDVFLKELIVDFEVSTTAAYLNQSIQLTDYSTGPGTLVSWDFGDGESSVSDNPTHAYTEPGKYSVVLTKSHSGREETKTIEITVLPDLIPTFTIEDGGDFESDDNFAVNTVSGTGFERAASEIAGKDGVVSGENAFVTGPNDDNYQGLTESYLHTPNFFMGLTGTYTLSFSTKYDFEPGVDGMVLQYSLDRGKTWSTIQDDVSNSWYNTDKAKYLFNVFGNQDKFFSGSLPTYETKTADISFLAGNQNVAFRFAFKSDMTQGKEFDGVKFAGAAIDDFELTGPIQQLDFEIDKLSACTNETITYNGLSEVNTSDLLTYEWNFGQDATPQNAIGIGPHEVSYSSKGLKDVSITLNGLLSEMKNEIVNIFELEVLELTATQTELCPGEFTSLIFDSQPDVTYQLINSETAVLLAEVVGVEGGLNISIGPVNEGITIIIKAIYGSCSLNMSTVDLTIINQIPVISGFDGKLESTEADSYQWFLNDIAIPNATDRSFVPLQYGSYRVEVKNGNCTSISEPFNDIILGINDEALSEELKIYPNPVISKLNVSFENPYRGAVELSIIDLHGKIIDKKTIEKSDSVFSTMIDANQLISGVYFVRVFYGDKTLTARFSK